MRRFVLALIVAGILAVAAWVTVRAALASDVVRAALQDQLTMRLAQPVRIGAARAVVFPRVAIDLRDVAIGEPASVRLNSIRIVTGLRGLLSRVVADAEVSIDGGQIGLPLPFSLAPPAAPTTPAAPASDGLIVRSIRTISVRDVVLSGGGQTLLLDLESSLDGDRLDVRRLTARADRSRIEATGAIGSLSRLEGSFEATADPLDLSEIIAVASGLGGAGDPSASGAPVTIHMNVKFLAPEARFGAYAFRELSTTLDIVSGRLRFAPLELHAFGGRFAGHLVVESGSARPRLQLDGRLDNIDVADLIDRSGFAGGITGRLGGSVSLSGHGSEASTLIRNARGRLAAVVTGGRIPGLDLVRTIVLAFGRPAGAPPPGSGSSFSKLAGSFAVNDGVMASRDLMMESRDFDLSGEGSLRLSSGATQARVDVVLSRELTAQAGTDLRRYAQDNGRVILPATIGGTLEHPKVSLDIAAASRRAITNELKRRATSVLENLLKKK